MWSRRTSVICGVASLLLGTFSVVVLIELDDAYRELLSHELALREGSRIFRSWKDVGSSFDTSARFYFFNVTNSGQIAKGEKPQLQELGPYVYRVVWVKDNITFHENDTVSFMQKLIFHFDAEQSAGSENDTVTTVNVPYAAASPMVEKQSALTRFFTKGMLSAMGQSLWITKTVRELSFKGYPSALMILAEASKGGKSGRTGQQPKMADNVRKGHRTIADEAKSQPESKVGKFAYFAEKNDTFHGVLSMFTGVGNISRINQVDLVNGKTRFDMWGGDECNLIRGTFGNVRPPMATTDEQRVFIPDIKRSVLLRYVHDSKVGSVHTRRFAVTPEVFASGKTRPENACYNKRTLPDGAADMGPVAKGAPVAVSLPHFLYGNQSEFGVEGLTPDEDKHLLYVDSEPTSGVSVSARARMQMNVILDGIPGTGTHSGEHRIVPLFWQEMRADAKPHIMSMVRLAALMPTVIRCTAIFVLIASSIVLVISSYFLVKARHSRRRVVSDPNSKVVPDKMAVYINGTGYMGAKGNGDSHRNGSHAMANGIPEADALLQQSVV
ncbi:scavenger receptor class B member 1 [Ixodes scapularis]|uniref:scavenger receptor class B member 1 n=1 Tax=Ixodes scapularis TaxID=6945 RepID=UPI001A9F8AAC|nr:scavenger receptor class B member 1 [Ixodes scapularis]